MRHVSTKGYSLIEILLALGITSGILLAAYGLYSFISGTYSHQKLVDQSKQTVEQVQRSYAAQANYADLTMHKAMSEDLFAPSFTYENGRVFSGTVEASLYPIPNAEGLNGGGFALKYTNVSSKQCIELSTQMFPLTPSIEVNQRPLQRDSQGQLDIADATQQCNAQPYASMVFSFIRLGAAESLMLCQAPTGEKTQQLACPNGQTGKIIQTQHAFCNQAYGNPQWTAWETTEDSCKPCPADETRITRCPEGSEGTLGQKRTFNCSVGDWNPWTNTSSQCKPCPADETRLAACPFADYPEGFVISQKRIYLCSEERWSDWITTEATCKSP